MNIRSVHHVSLVVADTARSLRFYRDLLGLLPVPRPDLGFPGAWLEVNGQRIHLLEVTNVDPVDCRPERSGRDRHVAFLVDGLSEIAMRLHDAGVTVTHSRSGRKAIFCRDPDGNGIELIESD
ncbi:MAG: glyoxylase I family protein [Gammaproteobacteria bacterium]|nr:MAG: glyoxylase I family protein [Gammaproteobacteria bacterium]TND02236.1 MAG: glyoxylase I family protein [Gammaproteobacteria bacterium]